MIERDKHTDHASIRIRRCIIRNQPLPTNCQSYAFNCPRQRPPERTGNDLNWLA